MWTTLLYFFFPGFAQTAVVPDVQGCAYGSIAKVGVANGSIAKVGVASGRAEGC